MGAECLAKLVDYRRQNQDDEKKVKNYSIEWKIKKKVKFCQKTLFFYYEYDIIKLPRRDTGVIKPTK